MDLWRYVVIILRYHIYIFMLQDDDQTSLKIFQFEMQSFKNRKTLTSVAVAERGSSFLNNK